MQKLDKLFAGLLIVAMMLFWVIISPATVTSKIAEAKPAPVEIPAAPAVIEPKKKLTEKQRAFRDASRASNDQIRRLKQRDRDTPRSHNLERFSAPDEVSRSVVEPDDIGDILDSDQQTDFPVYN